MYYIIEIQKYQDGSFGHLVHWGETRQKAESKYHEVLSAAAISELPQHAACMITADGQHVMSQCYTHTVVPEPTPEPEAEPEEAE